ncbi:alpha-L-rhamnosidase-related protein [Paenibacillus sp. strain BS8-2]
MEEHYIWQAQWIWNDAESSPRNEWWCFRRSFSLQAEELKDCKGEGAMLRLTADSRYVLYLNGQIAGRGPVRSWNNELRYDTYDVSPYLKEGLNTIAVLVMHYGVSTFYYERGRGGLLAQLDLPGRGETGRSIVTDERWKTSRCPGQLAQAPRMSCQQAFTEWVDARLWNEDWTEADYNDHEWQQASVIGLPGMAPWKTLLPRDIPHLTEETIYPNRVESVHECSALSWSAVIDLRPHFIPESSSHANRVAYSGYLGFILSMEESASVTFGCVAGIQEPQFLIIDGERIHASRYYGISPERYAVVQLSAGEHLVLYQVTNDSDHGRTIHLGMNAEAELHLRYLSEELEQLTDTTPLFTIGPFESGEVQDIGIYPLNRSDSLYMQAGQIKSKQEALEWMTHIQPLSNRFVAIDDIFTRTVWSGQARTFVPMGSQIQAMAASNQNAAVIGQCSKDHELELVVDFRKEYSGYIQFELEAEAGVTFDFYGFEYMSQGIRQDTYDLNNTFRYVCREGRQSYISPIRRGLRYLLIRLRGMTRPVRWHKVSIIQSNFPAAEIGRFQCSNALFNEIWEISKHTTKLCMEDTFVDCPAYEQTFWVGDSRNEALISQYLFHNQELVERCLRLVPGSAEHNPLYMNQVPSGWNSVIPNWTFFWIIACEEHYMHTGDLKFAKEIWPSITYTLAHYAEYMNEDGLLDIKAWNLLDWAPMEQPDDGIVTHQNAFLVKALMAAARLGAVVEDMAAADAMEDWANKLRLAINKVLWCEQEQAYIDCIYRSGEVSTTFSLQTQVVCYLSGIAEGDRKKLLEIHLIEAPNHFVQIGSPFMSFFYYEALTQMQQYERMMNDMGSNYGEMLKHGATTCWEMYPHFTENRANPDMLSRSHCHAWSAAPAYFLGRNVLGVHSNKAGWTSICIEPQVSGLQWASGSVPLPDGNRVDVHWEIQEDVFSIVIGLPPHIEFELHLPEPWKHEVKINTY